MARSQSEKMVSILAQITPRRGVQVGGRTKDDTDPAMGYLMKSLGISRKSENYTKGGGGRPNPLVMAIAPKAKVKNRDVPNPMARALGMK